MKQLNEQEVKSVSGGEPHGSDGHGHQLDGTDIVRLGTEEGQSGTYKTVDVIVQYRNGGVRGYNADGSTTRWNDNGWFIP